MMFADGPGPLGPPLPSQTYEKTMKNTVIGVGLGLLATVFSGLANILIKLSHNTALEEDGFHVRPVYCRPLWWMGVLCYFINAALNFASYWYASLNVLAPTSSFAIVVNAVLAFIFFEETLSCLGFVGNAMIMGSSVVAVIYGSSTADELSLQKLVELMVHPHFIIFVVLHFTVVIYCYFAMYRFMVTEDMTSWKHSVRAICASFMASAFMTYAALASKSFMAVVKETVNGKNQFIYYGTYLIMVFIAVTLSLQLISISEMMKLFDAVIIVPLFLVWCILNVILCNDMLYREGPIEHPDMSNDGNTVYFFSGVAGCCVGVLVVAFGQQQRVSFSMYARSRISAASQRPFSPNQLPLRSREQRWSPADR